MTDRPILFSGPMVRAILDGRKTQTRRVVSPQPVSHQLGMWRWDGPIVGGHGWFQSDDSGMAKSLSTHAVRFLTGDRLWVREAWRTAGSLDSIKPSELPTTSSIVYAADSSPAPVWRGKQRPSMFMMRWASRITLVTTEVRVQRLQDITEADARAEGVLWVPGHGEIQPADLHEGYSNYLNCREGFQVLWDGLNAKRGFGWDVNPWVVAVTFSVRNQNIDSIPSSEAA